MRTVAIVLAAFVGVASSLGASNPIEFEGEYTFKATRAFEAVVFGSLTIGKVEAGHASIEVYFSEANQHVCSLEGVATVIEDGLRYEEESNEPGNPFVVEVKIDRETARPIQLSGPEQWNCGANARWGDAPFFETGAARRAREVAKAQAYRDTLACWAVFEFLRDRERAVKGSAARIAALEELADHADVMVGLRAPFEGDEAIKLQEADEAATLRSFAARAHSMTADQLNAREAACAKSIEASIRNAEPGWAY